MPKPLESDLCKRLLKCGVRRLLLGHTPHGNCPTIIRCGDENDGSAFLIVKADTSYSDMKAPDNRGDACSTIDVLNDGTIRVAGVLPKSVENGARIAYTVPSDPTERHYELVGYMQSKTLPDGTPTPERRFVKARLAGGAAGDVLLCHVDGFKVTYSTMSDAAARELLKVPTPPPPINKSQTYTSFGDEGFTGESTEVVHESRRALIARLFHDLDVNNDGKLERTELASALDHEPEVLKLLVGTGQDPPDPNALLDEMGESGSITLEYFVDYFVPRTPAPADGLAGDVGGGRSLLSGVSRRVADWMSKVLIRVDDVLFRLIAWYFKHVRRKRLKDVAFELIDATTQ